MTKRKTAKQTAPVIAVVYVHHEALGRARAYPVTSQENLDLWLRFGLARELQLTVEWMPAEPR